MGRHPVTGSTQAFLEVIIHNAPVDYQIPLQPRPNVSTLAWKPCHSAGIPLEVETFFWKHSNCSPNSSGAITLPTVSAIITQCAARGEMKAQGLKNVADILNITLS